jgi:hypothetical protein
MTSSLVSCFVVFSSSSSPDYSVLLVSYVVPPVSFVSSILRLIVASTVFSVAISLPDGSLRSRWLSFFDLMCRLSCAAHSFRPSCHFLLVLSLCRLVDIASTVATHLSSADVVSSRPIKAFVDCRVPRPSKPSPPFAHWCQCHHLAHSSSAECHRELYCVVMCSCHANPGYWLLVHQPSR